MLMTKDHHSRDKKVISKCEISKEINDLYFTVSGHIYWKRHYIASFNDSFNEEIYNELLVLADNCKHLESINVPVNHCTAYSHFHWFKEMKNDEPYKTLLSRCPLIRVGRDKIVFIFKRAATKFDGERWHSFILPPVNTIEWFENWSTDSLIYQGFGQVPLTWSDLDGLLNCFLHFNIPTNLTAIMSRQLNPSTGEKT